MDAHRTNGRRAADEEERQFVTFRLGEEEFGVPIGRVKEIVGVPEVARVPRAPEWLDGIANLRGSVLPLVDLRTRFALEKAERDEDTRVVVVEFGGSLTGIVVDRVSEVMRVGTRVVETPPAVLQGNVEARYLDGVAKLGDGRRLVMLLDIDRVLPTRDAIDQAISEAGDGLTADGAGADRASEAAGTVDEEKLVSFRLGREEFALAIHDVQEIIRVPRVSQVPSAPADVQGVISLRNQLVPILDLRTRFGITDENLADEDDQRVVVMDAGGVLTGIMVDAVSEVLGVGNDQIEPAPPAVSEGSGAKLRGVAKLDDGRRLILLLDGGTFLAEGEGEILAALEARTEEDSEDGDSDSMAEVTRTDSSRGSAVSGERQYVGFHLGNEEIGVDIQKVQEIIWVPEITSIPGAPRFVKGIVNLRGSVLPVVDLRTRFEMDATVFDDETSILVIDQNGLKTGLIVDSVSEVVRLGDDAVEPAPEGVLGADGGFVQGVGKPGDGRMLVLLDLERVLGWVGEVVGPAADAA